MSVEEHQNKEFYMIISRL